MNWTKEQLKEYLNKKRFPEGGKTIKRNKYNAKTCTVCGSKFKSKHEANGFLLIKSLEKEGKIKAFCRQPIFHISETITWRPDFLIVKNNGQVVVVEYKGFETVDFKLKKKLFIEKYSDLELHIVKKGETISFF